MVEDADGTAGQVGSDEAGVWRRVARPLRCLARRVAAVAATSRRAREAGMATAEYAIATVAAAGFAGLLVVVLRSPEVRELLTGIVRQALSL